MRGILLACCTGILLTAAWGQDNYYQSAGNKMYWKNKRPHAAYWQQDVAYNIKATIDETTDIITGEEQLTYWNNSPDTIYYVFFNLYQNAFQPGSYLDKLQHENDVHPSYGKYESARQGISIERISVGKAKPNLATTSESSPYNVKTELDNTILKVYLPEPLLPNSSTVINIGFRTFYDNGGVRRRMKKYKAWGFNHYNGCQWYPKICVYDNHAGWNTDQHLNREFYGDFGSWDVELNFASNFVVEATGVLQNESDVLPDSLKAKLHISNFKDKVWDSKPSVITPYKKGVRKTWKYHADNVHDFAFTADPTYRIADTMWNGVRCVAIVQEPHASGWQNAAEYCAKIIRCFSRDFGMYEYPKMVVADAADGMEYPMITLDGGRDPENRGLLVHEVAHNWFYGMLGNNETYRAMMDEGFTQFLTAWGMEHIDNTDTIIYNHAGVKNKYVKKFLEPTNIRDNKVYIGYMQDAILEADEQLNTHSDQFNGALGQGGGYRQVYSKTAAMLYNLQYVLGDSLFQAAMQHYVAQWKMCHPYPEDFRNSIIRFTKQDLNWFFDEWMEGTKRNDYKIQSVKKGSITNEFEIKLKRKGRMQMPIDLQVIAKNGAVHNFYIPNTWFEKNTADSVKHLSRWIGWDKLQPTYTATVNIPSGIKNVIIDPSERMADINMLNNRRKGNVEVRFDSKIYPFPSWKKYRLYLRPDIWYNSYDGFKIGMHLNGNYMNVKHVFSFTAWINTRVAQGPEKYIPSDMKDKAGWFSYRFDYRTAIDRLSKNATFTFSSRWLDGYEMYRVGITKQLPKNFSIEIFLKAFTRNEEAWRNYLMYPGEWTTIYHENESKAMNTSINIAATYSYAKPKGSGNVKVNWRSATLFNSTNYHYLEAEHKNISSAWKLDFRTRVYGRIGTGTNVPSESALYFAQANGEEMMENKYVRAKGFFPAEWAGKFGEGTNHFHYGGGLNLRGYAGYLMVEKDKEGNVVNTYKGNSGLSANLEIDFNRIVKVKNAKLREFVLLNTYLFADAGSIVYDNSAGKKQFSRLRADAGVGAALTIKKWGVLQGVKPLTIRFDVPFFLSSAPAGEKNVQWRFVVGVSRSF